MEIIDIELDPVPIREETKDEWLRVFPWRSPSSAPVGLKDVIAGKSLCDIGCAEGDMINQFSKHAESVVGIEMDPDRFSVAINRGLTVKVGNFFRIPNAEFPVCDVYYLWGPSPQSSMLMVDHLMAHPKVKEGAIILSAGRTGAPHVEKSVKKWDGKVLAIPYEEWNEDLERVESGKWWVGVIEKKTGVHV
jgi:hypothetical protein